MQIHFFPSGRDAEQPDGLPLPIRNRRELHGRGTFNFGLLRWGVDCLVRRLKDNRRSDEKANVFNREVSSKDAQSVDLWAEACLNVI